MVNLLIDKNGTKRYRDNNHYSYHRLNGPAHICKGLNQWICDGLYHRVDGPAIEYLHKKAQNVWYYKGKCMPCSSQEEFERLIKLSILW
jgi:hypothetical protein